jgi:hypothetical protein
VRKRLFLAFTAAVAVAIILFSSFRVPFRTNALNPTNLQTNTIFSDDFESYTVGSFPSPNWTMIFDGMGPQYQVVVDSVSNSPTKSLQLVGSENWASNAVYFFNSTSSILGYEVTVRVDNSSAIPQPANYNEACKVGFWRQINSGNSAWYESVIFTGDGEIVACNNNNFLTGQVLQSYLPDQWYNITVIVDRTNKVFSVWVNGVLEGQNLQTTSDPYVYQGFGLAGHYTQAINNFDDVQIFGTASVDSSPNMDPVIQNGGFEQGSTGWSLAGDGLLKITDEEAHGGNYSMKASSTINQQAYFYQYINFTDTSFVFSFWVYRVDPNSWTACYLDRDWDGNTARVVSSLIIQNDQIELNCWDKPYAPGRQMFNYDVSVGTWHNFTFFANATTEKQGFYMDGNLLETLNSSSGTVFNPDCLIFGDVSNGACNGTFFFDDLQLNGLGNPVQPGPNPNPNPNPSPTPNAPVYFSVEPIAVSPLTNVNSSINGLEIPSTYYAIGDNFTVEIHLQNATLTNVPEGIAGIQLTFDFSNIMSYCKPVEFNTTTGQPGGVFSGNVLYAENGFYDANGNKINPPDYSQATQYIVAAASQACWNGDDGLVATITFVVISQPSAALNQSTFYSQLKITGTDLIDGRQQEVPFSIIQGTLQIDDPVQIWGDINADGKVNLTDLVLLANAYGTTPASGGTPGTPHAWNPNADIGNSGLIGLTDLVILALHYGQHYP